MNIIEVARALQENPKRRFSEPTLMNNVSIVNSGLLTGISNYPGDVILAIFDTKVPDMDLLYVIRERMSIYLLLSDKWYEIPAPSFSCSR